MKTDNSSNEQQQSEILEEGKKQLETFKAELAELKEKASHFGEEAKKEFDVRSKEVEELYQEALVGYDKLKIKTEAGWQETRDFVALTNKALKHSFNYFLSHYRKK
jgi:phage-related minor tail protein